MAAWAEARVWVAAAAATDASARRSRCSRGPPRSDCCSSRAGRLRRCHCPRCCSRCSTLTTAGWAGSAAAAAAVVVAAAAVEVAAVAAEEKAMAAVATAVEKVGMAVAAAATAMVAAPAPMTAVAMATATATETADAAVAATAAATLAGTPYSLAGICRPTGRRPRRRGTPWCRRLRRNASRTCACRDTDSKTPACVGCFVLPGSPLSSPPSLRGHRPTATVVAAAETAMAGAATAAADADAATAAAGTDTAAADRPPRPHRPVTAACVSAARLALRRAGLKQKERVALSVAWRQHATPDARARRTR